MKRQKWRNDGADVHQTGLANGQMLNDLLGEIAVVVSIINRRPSTFVN